MGQLMPPPAAPTFCLTLPTGGLTPEVASAADLGDPERVSLHLPVRGRSPAVSGAADGRQVRPLLLRHAGQAGRPDPAHCRSVLCGNCVLLQEFC